MKSALSMAVVFHKNSLISFPENFLILVWYTFRSIKTRTLIPHKFKNQTNDKLEVLGQNCNHQQGHLKQKIVALHHCGFNLKLLKHF